MALSNHSWSVSILDWFQMRRCFHQTPWSCRTLLFHLPQDPTISVQGCYRATYMYTIPMCHLIPFRTFSAVPAFRFHRMPVSSTPSVIPAGFMWLFHIPWNIPNDTKYLNLGKCTQTFRGSESHPAFLLPLEQQ